MKVNDRNKKIVIKLLKQINKLTEINNKMYDIVPIEVLENKDEYVYYQWHKCQDIIFKLMANTTHKKLNATLGTPSGKQPVAWYMCDFDSQPCDYIIGPIDPDKPDRRLSGYIPDRMTDVVFHKKISAKEKYKLLKQMFADIGKVQKLYKLQQEILRG